MINLLLTIDAGTIDWSRAQFALTALYHWLFVPLTLGLAFIMAIVETCYYRTKKRFWKDTAKFWQKLFGVNFAMGVATGIILEFEFGTNWSNYSWFVGDIFGAPLAIEGIVAFFMEATFVAVMFFGWNKVSRGFHLASTWLTGIGATLSACWILIANGWMQYPVGCEFNPDTVRNEMTSFLAVATSPVAMVKFFHAVISSWIVGAVFVIAVSGYYLLKRREQKMATESIKVASVVGLVGALVAAMTGDTSAYQVAKVQPMKLAAMEALYEGDTDQGLTIVALLNPFEQPDYTVDKEPPLRIAMPNVLSMLATRDIHGYVPGVRDIIDGYTAYDGTVEPSYDEKIRRGKEAITALAAYRKAKAEGDTATCAAQLPVLEANMPYFGYGYIKDTSELVPFIPVTFYAFRIMVGAGCLYILFFLVVILLAYRKDITRTRWIHVCSLVLLPIAYIASECGWVVAEIGRQPWTIQDMLPTCAAVSDINPGSVMLTFFIFLVLFTVLFAVEVRILCAQIKKGVEHSQPSDNH